MGSTVHRMIWLWDQAIPIELAGEACGRFHRNANTLARGCFTLEVQQVLKLRCEDGLRSFETRFRSMSCEFTEIRQVAASANRETFQSVRFARYSGPRRGCHSG